MHLAYDYICVKSRTMFQVKKKAKIRNRYDKNTRKHHTQESQEVSPYPAGDHNAARNRKYSITDKHDTKIAKRIHKRSTALEWTVKIMEDLHMFTAPTSPFSSPRAVILLLLVQSFTYSKYSL